MPRVTFNPSNKSGDFEPGTRLLDAAKHLGLVIAQECGGFASCSTCRVRIEAGGDRLSPVEFEEEDMMDLAELGPEYRLSCQAKALGDVVVLIEEGSREKDVRLKMPYDPAL